MTNFSIFAVDGSEQAISEPEFNVLRNTERYFEYTAGDMRALLLYSGEFTNDLVIPEKGVERFFDKTVFVALIRMESNYRRLCKKQGMPCPKRFVLYNEGDLRVLTYVNSGVRVTSTTEEERAKKKTAVCARTASNLKLILWNA